jgi:Barstar (barnase inhibitor)
MAVFRDSELTYIDDSGQERQRLDWAILQCSPLALYYRPGVLDSDMAWLKRHGYTVAVADCGKDPNIVDAICESLGFPPGASLDGFNDYCWQIEVPDDGGFALALLHYNRVAKRDRKLAEQVLDIIANCARDKLLFGRRFVCLVQSDDPKIDFRPVGGQAPCWNPREGLLADRGL